MACGDEKARFDRVILDPQLLVTAPPGGDGDDRHGRRVARRREHGVESRRTRCHRCSPARASRLLGANFLRGDRRHPGTSASSNRAWTLSGTCCFGAHLAGAAIETSMLGAAHACANPLTAVFDVTHGAAIGLMLPARRPLQRRGVRRGLRGARAQTGTAAECLGVAGERVPGAAHRVPASGSRSAAGARRDVGVGDGDIETLARAAAEQWTASFNPRPVGDEELRSIYAACLSARPRLPRNRRRGRIGRQTIESDEASGAEDRMSGLLEGRWSFRPTRRTMGP